jgi:SAM-dependent methyltransferase
MTIEEQVFFEIHRDNPREGPGSFESTRKAFRLIQDPGARPVILDAGCGPGAQTFHLAELSFAEIHAIDIYQQYLDQVQAGIAARGLEDRIFTRKMDMGEPEFPDGFFDIVWAEGSIYQIGFANGLNRWRRLLKPGGCIAATEISWLKENPPSEVFEFWNSQYPGMRDVPDNLKTIAACGYRPAGHFTIPDGDWWNEYYMSISSKLDSISRRYAGNAGAMKAVEAERTERGLFRKYSDFYGYEFYIMQKK